MRIIFGIWMLYSEPRTRENRIISGFKNGILPLIENPNLMFDRFFVLRQQNAQFTIYVWSFQFILSIAMCSQNCAMYIIVVFSVFLFFFSPASWESVNVMRSRSVAFVYSSVLELSVFYFVTCYFSILYSALYLKTLCCIRFHVNWKSSTHYNFCRFILFGIQFCLRRVRCIAFSLSFLVNPLPLAFDSIFIFASNMQLHIPHFVGFNFALFACLCYFCCSEFLSLTPFTPDQITWEKFAMIKTKISISKKLFQTHTHTHTPSLSHTLRQTLSHIHTTNRFSFTWNCAFLKQICVLRHFFPFFREIFACMLHKY